MNRHFAKPERGGSADQISLEVMTVQRGSFKAKKRNFISLIAAAALIGAVAVPSPSSALSDEDKAKLAGAILGIAIAREVVKERKRAKARGEPYQAATDVMCFPEVRKCYWHNRYSSRWTHREFR